MFCATVLITGQCVFACNGTVAEFERAWNWPASVYWDNAAQELADDHGKLPLLRQNDAGEVIWVTEAEPSTCSQQEND